MTQAQTVTTAIRTCKRTVDGKAGGGRKHGERGGQPPEAERIFITYG